VDGKTLAEMGREAKDTLSHRALALRALAELLGEIRIGDNSRD
jgi:inosine/xanthosine triphosphate pyrophosphatase family protein